MAHPPSMAVQVTTFRVSLESVQQDVNAPTLCIHVKTSYSQKDIRLATSLNKLLRTSLPSSSVPKPPITWTKVNLLGLTPSPCIFLKKLYCFLQLPILHIFCKLLNPCKRVQLQNAWCHCSHLCCHPWQVSSALKPEYFSCLHMCQIQVPLICLQK